MTGFKKHSIGSAIVAATLVACLAAAPAAFAEAVAVEFISVLNPDTPAAVDDFEDEDFTGWFVIEGNQTPDESGGQLHLDPPDFVVLPVALNLAEDVVVVTEIDVSALPAGLSVSLVIANDTNSLSIAYFGDVAFLLDQNGTILGEAAGLDAATTVRLVFVQPAGGGLPFAQVDPGADGDPVTIENTATALDPIEFVGFRLQDADADGFSPPEDCDDDDGAINADADDSNCDGVDDDCDGTADDDFVSSSTVCGVGACASTGDTSCEAGSVVDSCTEGTPTDDANCDGVDDDCDGTADDDFVSTPTACGVGACASTGDTSCEAGSVVDSCTEGTPADDDATCDGIDDDCDGQTDEDFAPASTNCGTGPCASEGVTSCVDGSEEDSCTPGEPLAGDDATCDGVDDDCDGTADDDFVSTSTSCGVGDCSSIGDTSCVDGEVVDDCTEGEPAEDDATCDGQDDDCDGETDEDFQPEDTDCGVGACASTGVTSCVEGDVTDSCTPGEPTDEVCDGIDNDCNNVVDDVAEGNALTFFLDDDGDGFGNPDIIQLGCDPSKGFVENNTDCNDNNPNINPDADEVCDGLDNDCDGQVDGPGDIAESTLYSVSPRDDILRSVDPATGDTLSEVRITLERGVIRSATGLVYDPVTHKLTALLRASVCQDDSRTVNTTLFDDDDEPMAAGIDFATCERFDGDESACLTAFQSGRRNLATSCWYNADEEECRACNPNDEGDGFCTNSCIPAVCPNDPSRTIFAGGPGTDACEQFDDDEESCNAAFHRGRDGVTSCFFDDGDCEGCGPNNLRNGNCVDTCGGLTGRLLVTIDPITGEATLIGDTRDRFAGLAVDKSGRLLGVTGDGAIVPETLFDLNRDNAFPTLVTPFGTGEDGEVIATQPFDNFLYHGGGCCDDDDDDSEDDVFAAGGDDSDEVFERLDLASLTTTRIPVGDIGEPTALVYWVEAGVFIWANFGDLIYVTPDGEVSFFIGEGVAAASGSSLDHDSKGLAFVRDVTGSDCDANGALDSCDLQVAGTDVNGNGVLDLCDDDDTEPPVVTPPAGGGPPPLILTEGGAADENGNFAANALTDDDELRAELTVSGAVPGTEFDLILTEGSPSDAGFQPGGTFAGFANGVALPQTLTVLSDAEDGTFFATIAIYFSDELFAASGLVPSDIEIHVLDEDANTWAPAGTSVGNALPPADDEARALALGQSGFFHDDANQRWCFWAVVDQFSMFAVGAAEVAQVADLPDDEPADDGDDVVVDPDDGDTTPPPADEPPATDPTPADEDGDGVIDADDLCLRTEAGAVVDADGCPAVESPPTQTEPSVEIECGNGIAPCGVMGMLGLWGMFVGLGLMKFARPRVRRR